jgi:hypothetical protein
MSVRALLWLGVLLLGGGARAGEGGLRFLPSDTKMVLTVHTAGLADREKKEGQELIRRLYFGRFAPELGNEEKLPLSDVRRVVIGWPHAGTLRSVIVVRGKIDRKLLQKQLLAAAKANKNLTVEEMGKPAVKVYRRRLEDGLWTELFPQLGSVPQALRRLVAPPETWLAALDDETLFVSLAGRTQMARAVRARPAETRPRTSDELTKLLRKQDEEDLASFALVDDSLAPALQLVASEAVKETFEQFEHVTARVIVRARPVDGLGKQVEVVVRVSGKSNDLGGELATKGERALKQLRANLAKLAPEKGRRAAFGALLKGFRVSRKDAVVTLTGKLPEEDARKLLPVVPEKGKE